MRDNSGRNSNQNRIREKKLRAKEQRAHLLKKKKKRRTIILSILFIILAIIVASGVYFYTFLTGIKKGELSDATEPVSSKEPINILVLGMDIGDADNPNNKEARRTDTIMVVNYNPITKNVHVVSIPRDTMIEENAMANGQMQRYWKINAAYALGGEDEIKEQVEKLIGIKLNYTMEIDYAAFRNIIDALGGVEMTIKQDMIYDDNDQDLHINFKAGETVHLNGAKAEEYFRWRKNNDGTGLANGDLDRIDNQHEFIQKLVDKALTPAIVVKAPKLLKSISDNIQTNIPTNKLLSLGMEFSRLKSSNIIMKTLEGTPQDLYGQSFLVVDKASNKELIDALNTNSDSATKINKNNLNILVVNGTKITGLAGSLKDRLVSLGYSKVETSNGDSVEKSVIQTENDNLKDMIKEDSNVSKFNKFTKDEYKKYDVVIVLGSDYKPQ